MFDRFRAQIGWRELGRRTFAEFKRDDVTGLAAQLSYYLVLSVFPALVCLIALASLFPLQDLTDETTRLLGPFLPTTAVQLLAQFMVRIGESHDTGLLSAGLLLALWSSSTPMVAVANVMNRAYGVAETRSWWKVRLTAIALSAGLALFILIAFSLVIFGPQTADLLARWFGLNAFFVWSWKILQWPLVVALVATAIGSIYYLAPDVNQRWVVITPGSILATFLWLAGSLGFRYYAVNFGSYEATYGAIGGMMLLLMWFYVSAVAILVGAELDAEIHHASSRGNDSNVRTPGDAVHVDAAAGSRPRPRPSASPSGPDLRRDP
jgi:membrane protein